MNYRLLKDLPSCHKGRVLRPNIDGSFYVIEITDKEKLKGLKEYSFPKIDVINNPHWFEEITNK